MKGKEFSSWTSNEFILQLRHRVFRRRNMQRDLYNFCMNDTNSKRYTTSVTLSTKQIETISLRGTK